MATMGRPRQFDREEALRQAMALFWEYGYESTSLAQLRQAMGGISSASFYAAFGSKEALYEETVELYLATVGSQMRAVLNDAAVGPLTAIGQALRLAADNLRNNAHPAGCMVVLSATNCAPQNDHLRRAMARERENTRLAFQECLQRGIDAGGLPPGSDAESLALFLSTVLNGLSIQARDGLDPSALHRIVDTALASLTATDSRTRGRARTT